MHGIAALQTGAKDVFTSFQRDVNKDVEHTVSYADICYFKNVPEPLVFMHSDEVALFKRATRRKLHARPSSDSTLTFIIRWIFDHTYKSAGSQGVHPLIIISV
jgi:hypothetical protein